MKQLVTLKDVAAAAGLSVATVSRALQNRPEIPARTRDKVAKAARELGYRPNPMLGALMTQIRNRRPAAEANLACLYGRPTSEDLIGSQDDFIAGAVQAARELGYNLDLFDMTSGAIKQEELGGVLRARHVRGVILKNVRPSRPFPLPWDEMGFVLAGHCARMPGVDRVGNEIYQIVKEALDQGLARGYSRPALALPLRGEMRAGYRWPGAMAGALLAKGVWLDPAAVFQADWNRTAFTNWFKQFKPDLLLSLSDQPQEWLAGSRIRAPRDYGFIHLATNLSKRPVAGLSQDFFAVGQAAIHVLDSNLRRNQLGIPDRPATFTIAGKWQDGKTLRSAPN